jgi:hypothetical protein
MRTTLDSVTNYLEAIEEINNADRELDQILGVVTKAARVLLKRWATLSVVGIDEPFIPSVTSRHPLSAIDSSEWPSIERIALTLSRMHRAYEGAQAAWNELTPESQNRLTPPPAKLADD